jgi:DNA processing protein
LVLNEGIKHFKRKRAFAGLPFDRDHVLALSEFPPGQPWSPGAVMTRNATIAALARAMLVIEAREKGGTLNAGPQAIEIGRPVFAVDYAEDLPEGNRILFARGAAPLPEQERVARCARHTGFAKRGAAARSRRTVIVVVRAESA